MNTDVIKSFLVGLGFGVDDASLSKFNKAIAQATLKVSALYGSVKLTAAAISYSISKISEGFEQMGYEYRLIAPAINKVLVLRREMLKAYAAAGINITKVVQQSVRLNFSLAKTKFAFEALYKSVASRFFGVLTKQSDDFRKKFYANLPQLQHALERFIQLVFKALEATTVLGGRLWQILTRVYDFFVKLDKATDGWSTVILEVVAAWKLLNLSFLATPLGLLIGGLAALLALWDDFKTFKEGGQSLINWGSDVTRTMVGAATAIGAVAVAIGAVATGISIWAARQAILNAVLFLNPFGLVLAGITALVAAIIFLDQKWKTFGGTVSNFFLGIGDKVLSFVGATNVAANAGNAPTGVPAAPPLASNLQNYLSNQNVSQQTNINILGSADATATGKAVSSEQGKVNFNLVRNLKGATTPQGATK